ncbi:protein of unknown function [Nitrospira japonica]|uniref:Uncharacterized protein n=1 Tax=Nitrospira japonica TaxID=1325564 RepID=A0A1W1I8J4_9BACT|nr:protein of unknown function [Nitrospira japonica]
MADCSSQEFLAVYPSVVGFGGWFMGIVVSDSPVGQLKAY